MPRNFIFISIFCIVYIWPFGSRAQQFIFKNYSVNDGLPSSETYCTLQDADGFMWFGTDRGVVKFDGYKFTVFTTQDGLARNTVFNIYQDHKNRIWFRANSNQLVYMQNGKMHQHALNDELNRLFPTNVIDILYLDKADTIWLAIAGISLKITPHNKIIYLNDEREKSHIYTSEKMLSEAVSTGKNVLANPVLQSAFDDKGLNLHERVFYNYNADTTLAFEKKGNRNVNIYSDNKLLYQKTLNYDPLSMLLINGKIWIGSKSQGVHCYNDVSFAQPTQNFLNELSITSILQDREGNIWLTTLEDGIYILRSTKMLSYSNAEYFGRNKCNTIVEDGKNIWLGTDKGFVYRISPDEKVHVAGNLNSIVNSIAKSKNNEIWLGSPGGNFSVTDKQIKKLNYKYKHVPRLHFGRTTVWGADKDNLYFLENNAWQSCKKPAGPKKNNLIEAIYEDENGHVLLGCNNGLWKFTGDDNYEYYGDKFQQLNARIKDIKVDENGNFLIASQGEGILILNGNNLTQLKEKDGLLSNLCNSIYIDDEKNAWVSTNRGLNCITKNANGKYKIKSYTSIEGLISNEVFSVCKLYGNIWVSTGKGVTFFNPKNIEPDTILPALHITGVRINGKDFNAQNDFQLQHFENNLTMQYLGLFYKNAGKIQYKFKLKGIDTGWKQTENTSVLFEALPPGKYVFEVIASNNVGLWSAPATLAFNIEFPFWKKFWFLASSLVFSTFLGGFLINSRIKQIVTRKNLLNELNQHKHYALRARMNPHFIFNVLNSIQNFILHDDEKNSLLYLSKFAALMRFILDNSAETNVPLNTELRGLNLYLELEKLRFKDKLTYTINVGANVNTRINVPALCIQPFVENAIIHGLKHKRGGGHISVEILNDENNNLICIIEDDGVGRKRSSEYMKQKQPLHKSTGIKVTEDRIDLLNTLYNTNMKIEIEDLYNEGEAAGTRVKLLYNNIPENA